MIWIDMLTVSTDNNDAIFYIFTLYMEMQIKLFLNQTITWYMQHNNYVENSKFNKKKKMQLH